MACEASDNGPFGEWQRFIPLEPVLEFGNGSLQKDCRVSLENLPRHPWFLEANDPEMALCCLSALWLFQGDLEESHRISQSIPTVIGSYLHGIMHREEGDFSNAKYWFRKAGSLSCWAELEVRLTGDPGILPQHQAVLGDSFNSIQLVDFVSRVDEGEKNSLARVAYWELYTVFEYCFRQIRS
ncbi:MAG: hypothetical protein VX438_00195 [Planctomycetota bacterium]|nr:hypothetical protein [Planctomycetota bacterium]